MGVAVVAGQDHAKGRTEVEGRSHSSECRQEDEARALERVLEHQHRVQRQGVGTRRVHVEATEDERFPSDWVAQEVLVREQ